MNFFQRTAPKRSPLKAPPLRYAGQSLDEEIQKIIDDKIDGYGFWIVVFVGFTFFEWIRRYTAMPPQPVFFTLLAVFGSGYALFRIGACKRQIRQLRTARDGERAVGQYLEALREKGYRVFHDVCSKGFNIDHVLVGVGGIFTVETKTISKPAKGRLEIQYDGEQISVNGFVPDRDPIIQAKAQAHWLEGLIEESTGKTLKVRPVVIYPGWFVNKQPKGAEVWVLNPKNLPSFLEHEDKTLGSNDLSLVAYHLSRYVRASWEKS